MGAAAPPLQLHPRRRCSPIAAAPRSICATAPPLPVRLPRGICSPAEEGVGEGKRRAAIKEAEDRKMMTKTKQKGREGAPYLLTWLSGEGDPTAMAARSPRQPVALRSPPARSCQVAQF